MQCNNCGAWNADNSQRCAHCGVAFNPYQSPAPGPSIDVRRPGPSRGRVKTYLAESILVTLFCCTICGIVGIVYAAQVDGHAARGDYAAAHRSSNTAKTWCLVGFIGGLLVIGVYVALIASGSLKL